MKKILTALIALALAAVAFGQAHQNVTVNPNGAGVGTFNTTGITYYLWGPPGATVDFSNVTTKGISGGGGGSGVTQIVAGTNITVSPIGGTGVVTVNSSAGGTPGGATTTMQYNNAGSFGGTSGMTWNSGSTSLLNAQTSNGTFDGFGVQNLSVGASAIAEIQPAVNSSGNSVIIYQTGSGYSGTLLGNTGLSAGIYTNANEPFAIGTNGLADLNFLGTGAATFNYALTATGLFTATSGITLPSSLVNGILYTKTTGAVVSLQTLVNALAYGADPTATFDSTTAIQNAINAVASTGAKGVYLPAGQYLVSNLNMTGLSGFYFIGDGINSTRIDPTSSTGVVLDLTGSEQVTIRGMQIGYYNQPAIPKAAILMGQISNGSSTEILIEDCYISGSYSVATLYDYGVPSSRFDNCRFYNYDSAGVPTIYLSASNAASITSAYTTIATGAQSTSDLTFKGCETHDFTQNSGAGPIWADGSGPVSYLGGNISCYSNGPQMVKFTTAGNIGWNFVGVTFYADSGSQIADIFNISSAVAVKGVTVDQGAWQATGSMFAGVASSTYDTIVYHGKGSQSGTPNMIGSGNAMTVINALVQCDGEAVNISTGSITQSILYNPGAITATTNTAQEITTAGMTDAGTLTVTGTSRFNSNVGLFTAPNALYDLYDNNVQTETAGAFSGLNAIRLLPTVTETSSANTHTVLTGATIDPIVGASNTANWSGSPAIVGANIATQINSGATGTVTQAIAEQVVAMKNGASGAVVTNAIGVQVGNSTATGTIANLAGIQVASQTVGGTNNTDLELGSTTISSGNFGIDQEDTYQDKLGGKITTYNNVATAGIGVTPVVSTPRSTAVTNSTTSLAAYTVPASDSSFEVSANVNVTAATTAAMTVTCTYTDETNTSRTLTLGFTQLSGATLLTSITNVTGTGPYESPCYHIRCKASTTITFATVGTVTGITYNVEGTVVQLQ